MGTQGEGYLLEKLEVAEGSCVKSILARLKDKEKKYSSAALVGQKIIAIVSGASLFKTEVLWGEVSKLQKAEKKPGLLQIEIVEKYSCAHWKDVLPWHTVGGGLALLRALSYSVFFRCGFHELRK